MSKNHYKSNAHYSDRRNDEDSDTESIQSWASDDSRQFENDSDIGSLKDFVVDDDGDDEEASNSDSSDDETLTEDTDSDTDDEVVIFDDMDDEFVAPDREPAAKRRRVGSGQTLKTVKEDLRHIDQTNIVRGKRRRRPAQRYQHPEEEAVVREWLQREG